MLLLVRVALGLIISIVFISIIVTELALVWLIDADQQVRLFLLICHAENRQFARTRNKRPSTRTMRSYSLPYSLTTSSFSVLCPASLCCFLLGTVAD